MPLHQMPNARLSKKNQLHMSTNIAVLLGLFRVSDLKLNKKKLENCGAFVIYLLNSTGNVAKFEGFYGCAHWYLSKSQTAPTFSFFSIFLV
jgi:hypothetical protein